MDVLDVADGQLSQDGSEVIVKLQRIIDQPPSILWPSGRPELTILDTLAVFPSLSRNGPHAKVSCRFLCGMLGFTKSSFLWIFLEGNCENIQFLIPPVSRPLTSF